MFSATQDALKEFAWIPEELLAIWVRGVKAVHEEHGWGAMPGILRNADTMTFFGVHPALRAMLAVATKSWRRATRREYQAYLASIVLAIECLGSDVAGWGTSYPEAKRKADEILDTYFIDDRTRLLGVYMPIRGELDLNEGITVLGPRE